MSKVRMSNQEGDEGLQESDKRKVKRQLVDDVSGSIGVVKDEDRRAARKEPSFTGLSRENVQSRFNDSQSIPQSGPTVPSTRAPTMQTASPINLQESDQEGDHEADKAKAIVRSQEGDRMRSPYGKQEGDEANQESDAFGDTRAGREGRLIGERRAKSPFSKQEGDESNQEADRIGKPKPIQTGFKGPYDKQEAEAE